MKEKMLKKLKSVKFWLSLSGAVVIVLQLFGLKISAPYVNEVVSAICSVFVILGIMVPDNRDDLPGEENERDNQGDADGAGDEEDGGAEEKENEQNLPDDACGE